MMHTLPFALTLLVNDAGLVMMNGGDRPIPLGNCATGELYLTRLGEPVTGDMVDLELVVGWKLNVPEGERILPETVARLALSYNLGLVKPNEVDMATLHAEMTDHAAQEYGGLQLAEVVDRAYAMALRYRNGNISPVEMAAVALMLAPTLAMLPPEVLSAVVQQASDLAPPPSGLILH